MEVTTNKEIMQVTQLPVIVEHLRSMRELVNQRVSESLSLVCTEETVQAVKKERASLNQQFSELEEQRKSIKSAVLGPYEAFETVYRECVAEPFKNADTALKEKISDVESEMKRRCEDSLRDYFAELCAAYHIDFLRYEQVGIKVDMALAKQKTPKKLRTRLAEFVASVDRDVREISEMEDAAEILAEFKTNLDAMESICVVRERHRRIEEERIAGEQRKAVQAEEEERVQKVEALAPPVQTEPPKILKCTFTVRTTMEKLKRLKKFIEMEGIQYE